SACGQSGRTPSGKDRCVHSLRWFVSLSRAILGISHRHPSCAGGQKWRYPFSLSPRCLHFAPEPPPDRSDPSTARDLNLAPCLAEGVEECSEGFTCFGDQRLSRSVLATLIAIDAKHKKSNS